MFNIYDPAVKSDDPEVTLKIPTNILKDLVMRAQENGYSVENELARRLARTLEQDLKMIESDNDVAFEAFNLIQSNPEFSARTLPIKK